MYVRIINMSSDIVQKIKEIYSDFTNKLNDTQNRKKSLLKTYRAKVEEAKIKELQKSIKS